jgi:hypothetical protein
VITLGAHEARVMAAFARRQLAIEAALAARVIGTDRAVGVYTAPPMDVMAFLALPATNAPDVDMTVTLASLADALEAAAATGEGLDLGITDPAPASWAGGVSMLPPADGWQIPMYAVARDLLPEVDAARDEFAQRARGASPSMQQQIAEEIWDRPAWAGLPMRVLHAAKRLGLLRNDSSRIAAATCGTWRRFSSPLGEVFARIPGETARFDLHVVR